MSDRRWSSVSYLDALRPEPGWQTEFAFLASYSADLVALVAVLMALAGLDDDRGSGSKVDFATALDRLKDRVRLIAQAGRLVAPATTPKILAILDRYVRDANTDETTASWHPKIALAKLKPEYGGQTQWRLWLGSRNLTRDLAWDVGLALVGRPEGTGELVEGIPDLGYELASRAQLPGVAASKVRSELRASRWAVPRGCKVHSVRLLQGEGRDLPETPAHLRKLIVVSPFLDGTVVNLLGRWGNSNTRRLLVSPRAQLSKLAHQQGRPLDGFSELLYLDAPETDADHLAGEATSAATDSSDEEPESRGLHAKIIYAEHAKGRSMWVGSANATQRGWQGPNTEVVAEMSVPPEVGNGLDEFVSDLARTVNLGELEKPPEPDQVEERLEAARKQVVNRWKVTQNIETSGPRLMNESPPHPDDTEIELSVALLGGTWVAWPRGATALQLPPVSPGEVTELVCCRLRLWDSEVSWLQRAPFETAPGDDRDRQAIARYLDPRTFLAWIRSLLTGDSAGDGGGDWDQDGDGTSQKAQKQARPTWWAPTLEEVLKAWTRDPSTLPAVDRKVRHYLKIYEEQPDADRTEEERRTLEEFQRTWQVLRRELVREPQ